MLTRKSGSAVIVFMLAVLGPAAQPAGALAAGDAYVYRLTNGYSKEVVGQLRYEVGKLDASGVTFQVTTDNAGAGVQRVEIYTKDGNGVRHPLESHGQQVEYEFAAAYPAYAFPLDPGKSWSVRVRASVRGEARSRSVRVDGKVLGNERIRVPAGEFDAVKIRRLVYPGDSDNFRTETQIMEFEWYAPALGRLVRTERRSNWQDASRCHEESDCNYYGAWDVIELVTAPAAKR